MTEGRADRASAGDALTDAIGDVILTSAEVTDVGATGKDYGRSAAYAWTPLHSRSAYHGCRRPGTAVRGTVAGEHPRRLPISGRCRHRRGAGLCCAPG